MTVPIIPAICYACARYRPADLMAGEEAPTCAAYPLGIPDPILTEGVDHRQPYPGDNGIRFLLAPGEEGTLLAYDRLREAAT